MRNKGMCVMVVSFSLLLFLDAATALATRGGGGRGGGAGGGADPISIILSGSGGQFSSNDHPGGVAAGTIGLGAQSADKYGEYGDLGISHATWSKIYNALYGAAKVSDSVGSVVSIFIPGTGAIRVFKVIHSVGKTGALTQDAEKKEFVGKVLTGIGKALEGPASGSKRVTPNLKWGKW